MSTKIRLPNITASTEAGKLVQMHSYMYQLVEQLNMALQTVSQGQNSIAVATNAGRNSAAAKETAAKVTFNAIKPLIIKSADIVNAYYDKFNARLDGLYVAKSDFGIYTEQTSQDIKATSTAIEQFYSDLQQILTDIENVEHSLIEVNAHIKSGLLYYNDAGVAVYGLEIGQRTEIDGVETFNKYARFTSSKLAFYDQNDNEVAYISDQKLYITHVEITGSLKEGGFVETVLTDGSVVTKWVGGVS